MKRGAAAFLVGLAIAAAFLISKGYGRYWPHEPAGLWGEGAALAVAAAVAIAFQRSVRRPWAAAAILLASYLAISSADPRLSPHGISFLGPEGYLHAPEGCPFSVRFSARPAVHVAAALLPDGRMASSTVAEGTDVGAATAFRAECLSYAPADGEARQVLLRWAVAHMAEWARRPEAARTAVIAGDEARLTVVTEGRDAQDRPLPTTVETRIVAGETGTAILVTSRLGGKAGPARRFLESLAPR